MTADASEVLLVLGLFTGGSLAGVMSWRAPLNSWVALALPLALPALGIGLAKAFC